MNNTGPSMTQENISKSLMTGWKLTKTNSFITRKSSVTFWNCLTQLVVWEFHRVCLCQAWKSWVSTPTGMTLMAIMMPLSQSQTVSVALLSRGKKKLTKDTMLFLGIEMAGRMKNATLKFFPWVVLELPYKEIGGGGVQRPKFFFEKCAEWWELLRKF